MMTVENDKCGICQEETSCDFITQCGHWFHESCLKTWLTKQNGCPYCKQHVTSYKARERLMWNMKALKIDKNECIQVMNFFELYIEAQNPRTPVPSYDLNTIRTLLDAGWDMNDNVTGAKHLLKKACEIDDVYRLNFLLESGIILKRDVAWHKEALDAAKRNSSLMAVKRIEKYFSTTSIKKASDGSTALHDACSRNDFALVQALLESGAYVNARNNRGVRPLHLACSYAHIQVINYLIEKGAEINCVDLSGKSPLYEAMLSKYTRNEVLARFLELKANLTYLDQDRNNLLHAALIGQKFENAEILLDHFKDIHALNCFNESYLHLAADLGPVSLIEKLMELGCDAKLKDSDGNTALHRAVMYNTPDVVSALLKDKKSEVNAIDGNNRTPLFLAMNRAGCSEYVKILAAHGADLNIRDTKGRTALDICLENIYI